MGKGLKNDIGSMRNSLDGYVIRLKKAGGESKETTPPPMPTIKDTKKRKVTRLRAKLKS